MSSSIKRIRARHARLAASSKVPDKTAPAFGTDEVAVLLAALDAAENALRAWRRYPCTAPCNPREVCRACQTRTVLDALEKGEVP